MLIFLEFKTLEIILAFCSKYFWCTSAFCSFQFHLQPDWCNDRCNSNPITIVEYTSEVKTPAVTPTPYN